MMKRARLAAACRAVFAWRARVSQQRRKLADLQDRQRMERTDSAMNHWETFVKQARSAREAGRTRVAATKELLKAALTVLAVHAKRRRLLNRLARMLLVHLARLHLQQLRVCIFAWAGYSRHCQSVWRARQQEIEIKCLTLYLLAWRHFVESKV